MEKNDFIRNQIAPFRGRVPVMYQNLSIPSCPGPFYINFWNIIIGPSSRWDKNRIFPFWYCAMCSLWRGIVNQRDPTRRWHWPVGFSACFGLGWEIGVMSKRSWLNWTGIETDFGSTFSGRRIPDDVTGSDSVLNDSEKVVEKNWLSSSFQYFFN